MAQHDHELPPARIAFVLDNTVVDILNTDERLAAIFLSNPTVVEVTDYEDMNSVKVGSKYNPETNEFTEVILNSEGLVVRDDGIEID
jgi:hypothetical protein